MNDRSVALNDAAVEDVRWRLESAMEKLEDGLLLTALHLIIEAGEVVEAMNQRWVREKAAANLRARADASTRKLS